MNALSPAFQAQATTALTMPAANIQLSPDAELIEACVDFMNLERLANRLRIQEGRTLEPRPKMAAAIEAFEAQQAPLLNRICELRPSTHAGIVVLARTLALADPDLFRRGDADGCANDRLIAAVTTGLIWKRPEPAGVEAELLTVCDDFHKCDQDMRAVYSDDPDISDEDADRLNVPLFARYNRLLTRMEAIPARTAVGVAAKAACLAQHMEGGGKSLDYPNAWAGRLLATLMRDAAALGTPHVAVVLPPADAELAGMGQEAIGLIEQYDAALTAWRALPKEHPDFNKAADLGDAPANRLDELFERADTMQPATLAGLAGKARLLQHQMRGQYTIGGEFCSDGDITTFTWNMLADVLRMAEGAS